MAIREIMVVILRNGAIEEITMRMSPSRTRWKTQLYFRLNKIKKCKKKDLIEINLIIGADCCASMTFIELPDSFHERDAVVALKKTQK